MAALRSINDIHSHRPRVLVVGLASCFGCQLQITNAEAHLMTILSQFDLEYWQLVTSDEMPPDCDVAIIEGAVTTKEAYDVVRHIRKHAKAVMSIGACATTAGVTGMAEDNHEDRVHEIYGDFVPHACDTPITPRPVSDVIEVDSEVYCCPIDPYDFIKELQRVFYGSNRANDTRTLCADCKRNETECFFNQQELCLGLITRSGCGARCVNLGRPCNGCAGMSPDANIEAGRGACRHYGIDVAEYDKALEMFNQVALHKEKG